MFENPRRGRQVRNFTTNVPKILDLKSSSEQIFFENCRWVPLRLRQIARLWQALLLCDNVCVNWFDSSWKIFSPPKGRNCSFQGGFLTKNGSAKSRRTYESVTQMYLIILLLKASWIHLLSNQLFHVRIRELNRRSNHIPLGDHSLD